MTIGSWCVFAPLALFSFELLIGRLRAVKIVNRLRRVFG